MIISSNLLVTESMQMKTNATDTRTHTHTSDEYFPNCATHTQRTERATVTATCALRIPATTDRDRTHSHTLHTLDSASGVTKHLKKKVANTRDLFQKPHSDWPKRERCSQ